MVGPYLRAEDERRAAFDRSMIEAAVFEVYDHELMPDGSIKAKVRPTWPTGHAFWKLPKSEQERIRALAPSSPPSPLTDSTRHGLV